MRIVVVYQREPHARQMAFGDVAQPTTIAERCDLARRTLDELQLDVDVWIDDLGDSSRATFGSLPNWAILVDRAGVVRLKLPWCVPEVVDRVLDEIAAEGRPGGQGHGWPAPADATFLAAVAMPAPAPDDEAGRRRARHHRDVMLAHLAVAEPTHPERARWLAELARDSAPAAQRAWAERQRVATSPPPGASPRAPEPGGR